MGFVRIVKFLLKLATLLSQVDLVVARNSANLDESNATAGRGWISVPYKSRSSCLTILYVTKIWPLTVEEDDATLLRKRAGLPASEWCQVEVIDLVNVGSGLGKD